MPSGASTGEREALELRDGDKKRYLGKGVLKAVANVNGEIAKAVTGVELDQRVARQEDDRARRHADQEPARRQRAARRLDGGGARGGGRGGEAALRASGRRAAGERLLPVPMMNILNGGAHADSNVDVQEFMVMPVGAPTLRRGAANGRRDLPRAARLAQEARALDRRRRRRRVRAEPEVEPRGARARARSRRQRRLQGRRRRLSRARRRVERDVGQRPLRLQEVGRGRAQHRADGRHAGRVGRATIRSSPSRTAWPKATGPAGSC